MHEELHGCFIVIVEEIAHNECLAWFCESSVVITIQVIFSCKMR